MLTLFTAVMTSNLYPIGSWHPVPPTLFPSICNSTQSSFSFSIVSSLSKPSACGGWNLVSEGLVPFRVFGTLFAYCVLRMFSFPTMLLIATSSIVHTSVRLQLERSRAFKNLTRVDITNVQVYKIHNPVVEYVQAR